MAHQSSRREAESSGCLRRIGTPFREVARTPQKIAQRVSFQEWLALPRRTCHFKRMPNSSRDWENREGLRLPQGVQPQETGKPVPEIHE
jgi:hypothetical protein